MLLFKKKDLLVVISKSGKTVQFTKPLKDILKYQHRYNYKFKLYETGKITEADDYVIDDDTLTVFFGSDYVTYSEDGATYNEGGGGGTGMSTAVKQALVQCFENVAWQTPENDGDPTGQDYIDALEDALYPVTPPAELVSITAVYTQSGIVYDTDTLDSLKDDLVVTALYEDETTEVVTRYTLSGSLTVGTSTITVSFEGKTDTFTVTVTETPIAIFEVGAIGKTVDPQAASYRYMYKTATAARARMTSPIINDGYVFTVTDASKYQLAAYDPESLTVYEKTIQNVGTVDCYYGGTKSPSWTTSDSVTTAYVWLALKKLDNTEFTSEELADGASAVFTFTKSS